jgi:hypothetical protein
MDKRYGWETFTKSVFWDKYKPGDAMTLLLYLDGDYLDIYVDGNDILLGTFVKVKREFIIQYQSLIKTNICDLSKVQWPLRTAKQLNTGEEYRALENLQLWDEPDMSGGIITTIEQGSRVIILEIGSSAVIDDVTTPWVQVKTSGGKTGWCFGLYLRETRFEPAQEEFEKIVKSAETAQINDEEITNQDNSTMPPETKEKKSVNWSIFGIGFIVLSAGGAAVLIIVKRKKQR